MRKIDIKKRLIKHEDFFSILASSTIIGGIIVFLFWSFIDTLSV